MAEEKKKPAPWALDAAHTLIHQLGARPLVALSGHVR